MSWFDQAIQKVRMAGEDPRVKAVLKHADEIIGSAIVGAAGLAKTPGIKLPVAINPLETRVPTTLLGKTGKAFNPFNPFNAAALVSSAIARKYLSPEDAQRVEYFGFGLQPGIVLNVLDAGAVNASEDQELQRYRTQFLQRANAEAAAKTNLGTPTPPPSAGNRVDASTPQIGNRQPAPVQAPSVPQFTEASLQAANTSYEAPKNIPLSQFYGAQQALGRELEKTGELQRRLKESGAAAGMTDAALMAWAQKNPGLAYRELIGRESRMGVSPTMD